MEPELLVPELITPDSSRCPAGSRASALWPSRRVKPEKVTPARRRENIRDLDIQRYARLRADHEHIHAPDEMAIGIVDLDTDRDAITGITDWANLDISDHSRAVLGDELAVASFFNRMARRIELRHLTP